jgi:hypothetical protein
MLSHGRQMRISADLIDQPSVKQTLMEMLPVTPERKAQLDDYAQRHGQDTAAALDDVLATYLEWELRDYNETVETVLEAYEDVKAGCTQPAGEFLEELRVKHGFPR